MNIFKQVRELTKKLSNIEDVLIDPNSEKKHVGSELDIKLDVKDFEKFKKEVVGEKKSSFYDYFVFMDFGYGSSKKSDPITLLDRITAMENYLGIEYKNETKEFNGYKKIAAKKK